MGDFNVWSALLKVVLTFGLLFLTLKMVCRLHGPRMGGGGLGGRARRPGMPRPVEVIGRSQLGRSSSVAVVRVGERCLALGVTDQNISVLTEVELGEADLTPPPPAGTQGQVPQPSWRELVETLRERTVRR
jgi:flagellar protein FliO/FliZ